ncbi:MAG: HlyD family secretion protein [Chloroflexota bacterium]|nr:HlyD family secretion protein [Chloroflexota bacterium]
MRSGLTPSRAASAGLVVVALVIVALVLRSLLTPAPPVAPTLRTAVVIRDTVRTVASEAGTLVPVDQQNVNFRQAGQLREVTVKVGDHVKAGQVLARIDDRSLQNTLAQALQRQQQDAATLNGTVTGNQVSTAQHNVDAAQTTLASAQRQADLTTQQDAVTVAQDQSFLGRDASVLAKDQGALNHDAALLARDRSRLDADTAVLQRDQAVLAQDQAQLARDQGRLATDQTTLQQDQAALTRDQAALQQDQAAQQKDCPPPTGTGPTPQSTACTDDTNRITSDNNRISSDQSRIKSDQSKLKPDQDQVTKDQAVVAKDGAPVAQDQAQVQTDSTQVGIDAGQLSVDRQLVSQDSTHVEQDQTTLRADLQKQAGDRIASDRAVSDAQAALQSAQDALGGQTTLRPNTIAGQQAVVSSDQAAVDTARQNVEEATLVAPVDGTVASINGAPGEPVTVGQNQTPRAPGSTAPLPDTSAGGPLGGSSLSTGGTSATQAFMVLSDVHSFQVVATVAELDAARVNPGQQVKVSVDAVPGISLPGTVVAVQPVATLIQNVTNYLVTVGLDSLDKRLRSGMTAHAAVAVSEARQVLAVPSIAIQHSGGRSSVIVVRRDGTQAPVDVRTGLVGDSTTEVVSGLSEGDHVLLPDVTPPGALARQPLS